VSLNEQQIEERVTELGLDFALVTDWTSFVAVSRRIANADPSAARDADVPLPMPAGVGPEAYGEQYMTAQFGGSSAPEPGLLALFAMLTVMLLFGAVPMRAVRAR
jgi:Ca-activated chloride channel family protein